MAKANGNCIIKNRFLKNIRNSSENTGWGKRIKNEILNVANFWVNWSDEKLIQLIPDADPTALTPGQYYGDPLTGGNRDTLYTSLESPYRWYNPKTDTWWYDGCEVIHPITGERVNVRDDGSGFKAPDGFPKSGQKYMFIAAYRLFIISTLCWNSYAPVGDHTMIPGSSGRKYESAIPKLAQAYVLTGDINYAWKALILIGRLAELYPFMSGTRNDGTHAEGMHWGEVSTTESFYLMNFFRAYDLVFDVINENVNSRLSKLFSKVSEYNKKPRQNPFMIRQSVEKMANTALQTCHIGRQTHSDWKLRWIETEMNICVCMQRYDSLKNVLFLGEHCLQTTLFNNFYRDGRYHYDSTSYMRVISRQFLRMGELIYKVPKCGILADPEFPFDDFNLPMKQPALLNFSVDTGQLLPTFGDTVEPSNKGIHFDSFHVNKYHAGLDAQMDGLPQYDVWMEVAAQMDPTIKDACIQYLASLPTNWVDNQRASSKDFHILAYALDFHEKRNYHTKSNLLQDSPNIYLRCGNTRENRHDLVIWGQPSAPHKHGDKIGIWFGGRGTHLAASGGNYPFTWVSPKKNDWELHSAACWTVLIDGLNQSPSHSELLDYYDGNLLHLCRMENKNAYPTNKYERTVLLIPGVEDGDAYAVDIFRVANGFMFDYNTRGTDAGSFSEIEFSFDKTLFKDVEGTFAGDDVPLYGCAGYGWMKNVKTIAIDSDYYFTYRYSDFGTALRIHSLNNNLEYPRHLFYCEAEKGGHEMKKSPWDPHLILRQELDEEVSFTEVEDHQAQFEHVLESISEMPFIQKISRINLNISNNTNHNKFEPVGMLITLQNGWKDLLIINNTIEENEIKTDINSIDIPLRISTDATYLIFRINSQNKIMCTELIGGSYLQINDEKYEFIGKIEGKVVDIDYKMGKIIVELEDNSIMHSHKVECLSGLTAFVSNPKYGRTSPYIINEPSIFSLDENLITFRTNISLIHAMKNFKCVKEIAIQGKQIRNLDGNDFVVDCVIGDKIKISVNQIRKTQF